MQYPRLRSSAMLALCKLMAIDADFWSVISRGAYLELVFHEEYLCSASNVHEDCWQLLALFNLAVVNIESLE